MTKQWFAHLMCDIFSHQITSTISDPSVNIEVFIFYLLIFWWGLDLCIWYPLFHRVFQMPAFWWCHLFQILAEIRF